MTSMRNNPQNETFCAFCEGVLGHGERCDCAEAKAAWAHYDLGITQLTREEELEMWHERNRKAEAKYMPRGRK